MSAEDVENARVRLTEALLLTGEGDRDALARLYDMVSARLFGICLAVCGNRQAAEDVLQDVFITIWHRAGAYQPERGSPISWMATIARNRSIDWRRVNGRVLDPIEAANQVLDPGVTAEDRLVEDEEVRLLLECLEVLDSTHREPIRNAFFGGLTYSDLAKSAGVPLGTMKSWVRRGLLRLRECLGADGSTHARGS